MRLPQHQAIYDERMVAPMRQELTRIGFDELRTPEQVDSALKDAAGTTLVVVNSLFGCAARNAPPALTLPLPHEAKPPKMTTVFARPDVDATQRARAYFTR